MKTIMHVIDTTGPGGAETVFIELADRLRRRGYRSVVVIRGPGWVQDTLEQRGLEPVVLQARGSFNLPYLRQLMRLIRRERVDLVQSHLLGSNVYCALAGWLTRRPVVGSFHGMVDVSPDERLRGFKLWVMQRGLRQTVTVSDNLARAVAEQQLLDPTRNRVIYNGIDLERYGHRPTGALHDRLGLPPSVRLAVSLGNVRPAKAYEVLIAAAAQLLPSQPELHLVVAGHIKDSVMAPLRQQMEALGVADRIHFIGFVNDAASLLAEADLFVLSSRSEGFSIATVEALASGVPVVVTRCGGPEEIVTPGVDALMVPTDAPEALAEAMEQLLTDSELRQRLAEAGQQTARRRFGMQAMLDQYEALYRELL